MVTQAERRDSTRSAVVDAAFRAFEERGSPDVPLDEIARAAGVTKGTIHYHFGNRAGLLAALAVRLFVEMEERASSGQVTAVGYVRALLEAQAKPAGRVLFTVGDELLRIDSLGSVDPYRFLCRRLDRLGSAGPNTVTAGAIMQFGRQLAFGMADVVEVDSMLTDLRL